MQLGFYALIFPKCVNDSFLIVYNSRMYIILEEIL